MPVVQESVTIKRDPDELFEYLIQAENLPVWDSATIEAVQLTPGPPGLGTRTRGVSKLLGRRVEWVTEITAFEPGRLATWTSVEGPFKLCATSTVEPTASGSRYTYRVEGESGLGGVFGRLTDPFVARALSRIVRTNLATLADLMAAEARR
jgi:hypothetical protein